MAFGSPWTPPPRMRDREPGDIAFPISARRGTYSGGTSGRPIAKEACSQSMAYQTAAKSLGYDMLPTDTPLTALRRMELERKF